MKIFPLVLLSVSYALGQSTIVTTYVGPQLPSDHAGGFYVSSGHTNRVYRVTASGQLFLAAGTGTYGLSGDGGPATSAQLALPVLLTVDAQGNLYIVGG